MYINIEELKDTLRNSDAKSIYNFKKHPCSNSNKNSSSESSRIQDFEKIAEQDIKGVPLAVSVFLLLMVMWIIAYLCHDVWELGIGWSILISIVGSFIIVGILTAIFEELHYGEYNEKIYRARKTIINILLKDDHGNKDLIAMKKKYIEREIETNKLTKREFEWHSTKYCWGCGKEHVETPIIYYCSQRRSKTYKKRTHWVTDSYHSSSSIPLCPDCYKRINHTKQIKKEDDKHIEKIVVYEIVLVAIVFFLLIFFDGINNDDNLVESFFVALFGAFICVGGSVTLGSIVLFILAEIILLPFRRWKEYDGETKISFDKIPEIREFLNKDLPRRYN